MNPSELLDGRNQRGEGCRALAAGRRAGIAIEGQPVLECEEAVASRLRVFDGEAHHVGGGTAHAPIHGEESHPLAAVDPQFERRSGDLTYGEEFGWHAASPDGEG
jgi:hypothetical protein